MPPLSIRAETPADIEAIRSVVTAAFPTAAEANLIEALRTAGALLGSWVATRGGSVVGHVAFSPVTVEAPDARWDAIGLAPVAVAPSAQRSGVGGSLIRAGLEQLAADGHRVVVVLGSPAYYPRFGFERADQYGVRWEHDAPPEAFMLRELVPGAASAGGIVRYHPTFASV